MPHSAQPAHPFALSVGSFTAEVEGRQLEVMQLITPLTSTDRTLDGVVIAAKAAPTKAMLQLDDR